VAAAATRVRIGHTTFNSPGPDTGTNASLNAETVTLVNTSSSDFNLRGWTLREAQHNRVYKFGRRTLKAGAALDIHTGTGHDTATDVYWGSDSYVWDNLSDVATLRDDGGDRIAVKRWLADSAHCMSGRIKGWGRFHTPAGDVITQIYKRHSYHWKMCSRLPDGSFRVARDRDSGDLIDGAYASPFSNGNWFKRDALGHVFANVLPGNVPGTVVILLDHSRPEYLWYYPATPITKYPRFRIRAQFNDCHPNCANGTTYYAVLRWDGDTRTYRQ
jgi:hypothetical protein